MLKALIVLLILNLCKSNKLAISSTSGGSVFTLATASGEMYINRVAPTAITLPISNRNNSQGTFTMTIDDDTWGVIAGDPELINVMLVNVVILPVRVPTSVFNKKSEERLPDNLIESAAVPQK